MDFPQSAHSRDASEVQPAPHMPDGVVAIGASAGGVQVLIEVMGALPADFPAAILVVVHIGNRPSLLPDLLDRAGPLAAAYAQDGEPIVPGTIFLAPPDHHLLARDGKIVLSRGPKENRFRPAIDPLFRSVAAAYGPHAVGVILSGALTDGTIGLAAVKAHGGTTIVQDPGEALIRGMPANALAEVDIDYVLKTDEIANRLCLLLDVASATIPPPPAMNTATPAEASTLIAQSLQEQSHDARRGPTLFTCPDCGGTLWQVDEGHALRFQCPVGHGWSWNALLEHKADELETALWATCRLAVERSILRRQVGERARRIADDSAAQGALEHLALDDDARAQQLQLMITELVNERASSDGAYASVPSASNGGDGQTAPGNAQKACP